MSERTGLKQIAFTCLLLGMFFLWTPRTGLADTDLAAFDRFSLEDLMGLEVTSMGFFSLSGAKVPGTVFILDPDILETLPARTLRDIFQTAVPGVQMGTLRWGGGSLYMSRGAMLVDNATAQFLWDGANMNATAGYGVNSSLRSGLLGDISRMEISHSPSTSVTGNGSVNGMVNLVPKTGASHPGPFAQAVFGAEDQRYTVQTGYGLSKSPGQDLYLYAGWERAEGRAPEADLGYGRVMKAPSLPQGYRAQAAMPPGYRFSGKWHHNAMTFSGYFQREEISAEDLVYYKFSPVPMEIFQDTYLSSLVLTPGLDLGLTAHEDLDITFPVSLFDAGRIDHYTQYDQGDQETGNSETRLATQWVLKSRRWKDHQAAVGVRAGSVRFRDNAYHFRADPDPPAFFAENDVNWAEYAVFMDDIYQITPRWMVTGGIRLDAVRYDFKAREAYYSRFKTQMEVWSPRIATALELWDNTIVKLSYKTGFHFPRVTNLFVERFTPERVQTYEAGLIQSFPGQGLRLSLTGFFSKYQDSLVSEYWGTYGNRERQDMGTLGGEATLEWAGPWETRLLLSYAYSRPKDLSPGRASSGVANEAMTDWYCYSGHTLKGVVSRYWMHRQVMTSLAADYGSPVEVPPLYVSREIFDHHRYSISAKLAYKLTDHLYLDMVIRNMAGNAIPVPSYVGHRAWHGNLGKSDRSVSFAISYR